MKYEAKLRALRRAALNDLGAALVVSGPQFVRIGRTQYKVRAVPPCIFVNNISATLLSHEMLMQIADQLIKL